MNPADLLAFLLATMAAGIPHVATSERVGNGSCACSDCWS
jgi:hypothetical protein